MQEELRKKNAIKNSDQTTAQGSLAKKSHAQESAPSKRISVAERRQVIIRAALAEFAKNGFSGSSTLQIAANSGISQAYLFRLFPTKLSLFQGCIHYSFDLVKNEFAKAIINQGGQEALEAIGATYLKYLLDKDLLGSQLQAYALGSEPEIGPLVRSRYCDLWDFIKASTGASNVQMVDIFSKGMLLTVLAGMQMFEEEPEWITANEIISLP